MDAFIDFSSRAVCIPRDDIDTDQIIPARYLTTTQRSGLGDALFADWRRGPDGAPAASFPLNQPGARSSRVLIASRNFGCGSSREHAPWALTDFGFRTIIAASFGDIFRSNAHKNGLLTIALQEDALAQLHRLLERTPHAAITVSLRNCAISVGTRFRANFAIDAFSRRCLLDGVDELGYLLARGEAIARFERAREAA
jgi:3-isopropylmalate/(R)-2-methylmalate dehydratase small subunit